VTAIDIPTVTDVLRISDLGAEQSVATKSCADTLRLSRSIGQCREKLRTRFARFARVNLICFN